MGAVQLLGHPGEHDQQDDHENKDDPEDEHDQEDEDVDVGHGGE